MSIEVKAPYDLFLAADGTPLDGGKVYIGAENLNPETNPIAIYWDAFFTSPAVNPVTTMGGIIYRNGAASKVYSKTSYSITIKDKNGNLVYSNLANNSYDQNSGAVNAKWFGAKGDGVTDDTIALNTWAAFSTARYLPSGTYLHSGGLQFSQGADVYGDGWSSEIKLKDLSNPTNLAYVGSEAGQSIVCFKDIAFNGNKANNTAGDGLNIIRGYKSNLSNVRVYNSAGNGIVYSGIGSSFENYIKNCSSYANGGFGVYMTGGGVTDIHVDGGDIGYNTLGGVQLATSCSVSNATIWGGGQAGSNGVVFAGISSQVIGCKIEGHGKNGIVVNGNDYALIENNKIYANSFTVATSGLYDGISIGVGADFGTIVGNKIYSSVSSVSNYSMRYAISFAGSHEQWSIYSNDIALLTAGNPASFKTGMIVNGILPTDKSDYSWIRTNVLSRLSANLTPLVASTWTVYPLNTDDSDVLSEFSNGVFIPKNNGVYRFSLSTTFVATAANENIGFALYNSTTNTEIRRIIYDRSVSVNSQMSKGIIEEFLYNGESYDIRYFVGATTTSFLASGQYTYLKIKPIAV